MLGTAVQGSDFSLWATFKHWNIGCSGPHFASVHSKIFICAKVTNSCLVLWSSGKQDTREEKDTRAGARPDSWQVKREPPCIRSPTSTSVFLIFTNRHKLKSPFCYHTPAGPAPSAPGRLIPVCRAKHTQHFSRMLAPCASLPLLCRCRSTWLVCLLSDFPSQLEPDKGGCRQAPALYKSPFVAELQCTCHKSVWWVSKSPGRPGPLLLEAPLFYLGDLRGFLLLSCHF